MTAQKQPKLGVGVWQSEPGLAGTPPSETMRSWLLESGLLTARLKEQCGDAFPLQLVNEAHSLEDDEIATIRLISELIIDAGVQGESSAT